MTDQMKRIKQLIAERDSFVYPDGEIDYSNQGEVILILNDEGHIDWLIRRVEVLEDWQEHNHQRNIVLLQENNRYKQALEEIRNQGTYGTDIHSKQVARSEEAQIAHTILKGESK